MGIDFKGLAIAADRLAWPAEVGVTVAHSGPSSEVAGHKLGGALEVVDGRLVVLLEVVRNSSLVIGFGEIGRKGDGLGEVFESAIEFAVGQALGALGQFGVGRWGAAAKPDGPEGVLGHLIAHRARILQPLGQRGDAAFAADERQGEGGDFLGITMFAGEEGSDLLGRPVALEMTEESFEVSRLKQRADRGDKTRRIDSQWA